MAKNLEQKSQWPLQQNLILFFIVFFVLISTMSFYLGAKYGRIVLVMLHHEISEPSGAFLPDEKIYEEIRQILAESDQKFNFHGIVAERQSQIPVKNVTPKESPLVKINKPVVQMDALNKPKNPDVGSLIARELSLPPDTSSVSAPSAVHEEFKPVAKPIQQYKLQIGSFADRTRALKSRDEWRSRGYDVELFETRIPGKGRWFRLHIGSYNTREAALETQKTLLKKFHQTAMVLAQ